MAPRYQSQINQLEREVANLRSSEATEFKRESDLIARINRARDAANRTNSPSTLKSKLQEIEHANRDLASVKKKQADIAKKIADKAKNLRTYQDRQNQEDERERKRVADEQRRLMREREQHERRLLSQLRQQASIEIASNNENKSTMTYDFFICHASEDKEGFVRELATLLSEKGSVVWYDEFSLRIGDSLRRGIDRGLANSKFGVVILSESFFGKEWPQRELDGLVALATQGQSRILPIWHHVSKDEVAGYSPTLADRVALNTSIKSVEEIAQALMDFVRD